jgi:hypothetical protein
MIFIQEPELLGHFCGLRLRRYSTMKPEMKNQLKQMRKEGYGYKKIAKELGLTLSVVRYACIKINDEDLLEGHCVSCKPGYGFGYHHINIPCPTVLKELLKLFS